MRARITTALSVCAALFTGMGAFGANILGLVTLDGVGVSNVVVTAGGNSATTASNGVYSMSVPFGTHTVVPQRNGYTFSPPSRTVTLTPQAPIASASFAVVAHTISGAVRNGAVGVPNVTVTADTLVADEFSRTTDSSGNYSISVPAGNSYVVSPSLAGVQFLPLSRVTNNLQGNAAGFNFEVVHDVSGRVVDGTNGIEDAVMTLSTNGVPLQTTNSRSDGSFAFFDRVYGNYTIAARAPCYVFSPVSHSFVLSNRTSNLVFQVARFAASGRVTDGSNGISGVTIAAGTNSAVTDSNGYFSVSNLAGIHTFTPSKAGETFTPTHRTLTVLPGTTNVNFHLGTAAVSNTLENCTERELMWTVSSGGTVRLNCDGVISLTCPLPITQDTFIDATGRDATLDGDDFTSVFQVQSNAHLILKGLTIANGSSTNGGGIVNYGGTVTALDCTFATNQARSITNREARGGAIHNIQGSLFMTNCLFVGNAAYGNSNSYPGSLQQVGPATPAFGGAIFNDQGCVVLHGCIFVANLARGAGNGFLPLNVPAAGRGGAIGSTGGLVKVILTLFDTNRAVGGVGTGGGAGGGAAFGGAVYGTHGTMEFFGCAFSRNTAVGGAMSRIPDQGTRGGSAAGGALYCSTGSVALVASTLFSNSSLGGLGYESSFQAQGSGGAAENSGGTLSITNSTFAHNMTRAGRSDHTAYQGGIGFGGAISTRGGVLRLINSTVASNLVLAAGNTNSNARQGTNFYNSGTTIIAYNSVVAGGWFGGTVSGEYNLCADFTCPFVTNSLNGANPRLGPLQDNGGATFTMALLPDSPAIDAGHDGFSPATDQRGEPRPAGLASDLGAFEVFQPVRIFGFSPLFGAEGTNVVVQGASLAGATMLSFNGVSATVISNTATRIHTIVPAGALTGPISVTTLFGTTMSTNDFIVDVTPPALTFASPRADSFVRGLSHIAGTVRDNTNGSGAASVSLLLQRFRDFAYWTGAAWGAPTLLSTTLNGDAWQRTNGLPTPLQLEDGAYTISAQAQDAVGNTTFLNISVTVDKSGAIEPIRRLPDGRVQLRFAGTPGRTYRIEASADLSTWETLGSITIGTSGVLQFQDDDAPNHPHRFYRTAVP